MQIGRFKLTNIAGGDFMLDGGAMHGIIPKPMWQKVSPADDRNRVALSTNCLLVESDEHKILIDTGIGSKLTDKATEQMAAQFLLDQSLATHGIAANEIDYVIFTHLHFDHAGGATRHAIEDDPASKLVPAFPNAKHVVQKLEWQNATGNAAELAGTYFANEILPLSGLLETVETAALDESPLSDASEIVPGIRVKRTGGHTEGHQVIIIDGGDQKAIYAGDICPTISHVPFKWTMAYDSFPLQVNRVKPILLNQIADENSILLFDHEPKMHGATLRRNEKGKLEIDDSIFLND